jgi:hypothetical protein
MHASRLVSILATFILLPWLTPWCYAQPEKKKDPSSAEGCCGKGEEKGGEARAAPGDERVCPLYQMYGNGTQSTYYAAVCKQDVTGNWNHDRYTSWTGPAGLFPLTACTGTSSLGVHCTALFRADRDFFGRMPPHQYSADLARTGTPNKVGGGFEPSKYGKGDIAQDSKLRIDIEHPAHPGTYIRMVVYKAIAPESFEDSSGTVHRPNLAQVAGYGWEINDPRPAYLKLGREHVCPIGRPVGQPTFAYRIDLDENNSYHVLTSNSAGSSDVPRTCP